MKKIIFLVLLILLTITTVSAQYEYPSSETVEYGGETTFEFTKTAGASDGSLRAKFCGESMLYSQLSPSGGPNVVQYPISISINVPKDAPCGIGQHQVEFEVTSIDGQSTEIVGSMDLEVEAKGNINPHAGPFLYIVSDINNNNKLRGFFFSNNLWASNIGPWNDATYASSNCATTVGSGPCLRPAVMIEEIDSSNGDEFASWVPETGAIMESSTSGSIEQIIEGEAKEGKEFYQGGNLGDGGIFNTQPCVNDPCEIATESFTINNDQHQNIGSWARTFNTASPVHQNGQMMPDGDIIFGSVPEYYDANGDQSNSYHEFFYICREGATMYNGFARYVPQVVDVGTNGGQELKQCDRNAGKWKTVSECEDGLDNEGDGYVDHQSVEVASTTHDTTCSSQNDVESVESGEDCRTVEKNADDEIVYRYPGSTPEICDQQEILSDFRNDISPHTIDLFKCVQTDNGEVVAQDFANQDNDVSRANDFCSSKDLHTLSDGSQEVKAVEFMPEKEFFTAEDFDIDQRTPVTELLPQDWEGQSFFGQNGWRTGMQTLHQAEQSYSYESDPHEASTWARRGMDNLGPYRYSDPEDYQEAWESTHAGTVTTGESGVSDARFPGGFYGICRGDNNWKSDDKLWGCNSGIVVEFLEISPIADNNEENYVGLRITEDQIANWEIYTGTSPTPANSDIGNLEIKARCWQGYPEQRPSDTSDILVMSKEVAEGEDIVLAGSVPIRHDDLWQNGVQGDRRTYSCNYGFQQEFKPGSWPTGLDQPYINGQEAFNFDRYLYLVAGSNENGPIRSVSKTVSPPDDLNWFSEASDTDTEIGHDEVFQHFPSAELGEGDGNVRNPLDVCQIVLGDCQ